MSAERRPVRRRPALVTLAVGATLGAAAAARAHDVRAGDARAGDAGARDSLPARAGTYALEGGVGATSTSLGVLRFLSPRSALGVTLTAGASHQSGSTSSSTTTLNTGSVGLNLGYRRYGRLRDRITAYGTAGLTTAYSHNRQDQTQTTAQGTYTNVSINTSGSVGAFGELGASYLVLRRLTVNGSGLGTVSGTFTHSTIAQNGPNGSFGNVTRLHGVGAALGPVRFGLTLFL
ncbi:hypothetical protein tb265_13220 [Gemmatimonadetes bacterium T265]|nr:hypothetical protein tb265_13220 [Gemmatimonadetes bacterium T265]